MTIRNILQTLEAWAPSAYQESYDNARLITGDPSADCTGALLTLDAIEPVIDEAIEKNCNLVIAHHPIVFSGLKSLTGRNYIERTVIKAIRNDIAIYAIHTNLDNISDGVNHRIAQRLGLQNTRVLAPKKGLLRKLYTYVPEAEADRILDALFTAGAGHIGNYAECSFSAPGTGTFKGDEHANPFVGKKGVRHREVEKKLEVMFPAPLETAVLRALREAHPYEEVAYDIIALENEYREVGSGMIGDLPSEMLVTDFLKKLKSDLKTDCIRHTRPVSETVRRIALCGGAGSFLLSRAIAAGADVFITGDFKYHQFFDADGKIVIADVGHFESEQFTPALIYDFLSEKFDTFALHLSEVNTNPVNYL